MNKKTVLTLIIGLCAALIFVNCGGDSGGDEGPSLTVSPSNVTLASTGNEQTSINIECNSAWEVTKDANASWLTIGSSRGSKNGSFNIWAQDNTTGAERSATITVSVSRSDYYKTVTVRQKASSNQPTPSTTLELSKKDVSLSAAGGNDSFTIKSNTSWTISCDQSWCIVSPTSGSNDGTVSIKVEENKNTTERSAIITVKYENNNITVKVNQAAADVQLTASPTSLSFTGSGGSENITISSNTDWTVSSSQSWCTVSPLSGNNNGTITVTVSANDTSSKRSAAITIKNGNVTREISITQTAKPEGTDIGRNDYDNDINLDNK